MLRTCAVEIELSSGVVSKDEKLLGMQVPAQGCRNQLLVNQTLTETPNGPALALSVHDSALLEQVLSYLCSMKSFLKLPFRLCTSPR